MHISDLVFKKKKIFYFFLITIIIGGVTSFNKLSKLEDPEITIMVANVITVYPGASAHDVEMQVTNVLEDELSALADIHNITSHSEANVSVVQVELEMTVPQNEIPQRWEFLRRKLELAMPQLPEGVRTPIVLDDIGDVYGMFYAMVADDGFTYEQMGDYADFVRQNMLEVEGVRKTNLYGTQKTEVTISLSADKMSKMGVMPIEIISTIKDQTKELYAGSLKSGQQQLRLSIDKKSTNLDDIKSILINSVGGSSFRLGDIASIELTCNDPLRNTLFVNNEKAIGIGISMESGENILVVGEKVEEKLEELKTQIPAGISFKKVFFQPEKVEESINGFMLNLIISVLIVIIVLMFTMGFRSGLIIGMGLILTILATFPLLLTANGTLQRISLGAFIVAMGMLVDNAIVVLDGILTEKNKGNKGKQIYTKAAKQTSIPLLGATLIAIAAFFPVYLSPDTAGTYIRDLFIVLAISLSMSWVLALTQVPLSAALLFTRDKKKNKKKKSTPKELYNTTFYRIIRKTLSWCMRNRLITITFALILFAIAALNFQRLNKTFFPDFNYNQCYIEYNLPKGSTPDMVNAQLKDISAYINSLEEVNMVVTSHGMTPMRYCLVRSMMTENSDNYGELIVNFKDYDSMTKMRPVIYKYLRENHPDASSRIRKYNLSVKSTHSVEAQFTGPDPAVLKDLSHQVELLMLENKNIDQYTVCNDWEPKVASMKAIYSPIASNRSGTSRQDISNAILAATDGLPIGHLHQGEKDYPIRFRVRDNNGNKIEDLNDIPVWNSIPNINGDINGNTIKALLNGSSSKDNLIREAITAMPLSAVTNGVKLNWEEPVIRRLNGKRCIQAQCDPISGVSPAQIQEELNKVVRKIDVPIGYNFSWVGEDEMKNDAMEGILSFMPLSFGIIVLILLLLFNDYRRPLIVLLCLPMAIIGIVPGLLLTKEPFSFIAIVGVIGLSGMIIKNAIVLLDEIQQQLRTDKPAFEAVIDATISRVRPVIMASLTTILGMIPLISDPMYSAMAVSIVSGLLVGTIITLVFVPILYSAFFRVKIEQ